MYTPAQYQKLVNDYLSSMPYDRKPAKLYEPVRYELSLGGKRIRPVLMLMAYHLLKEDVERILPVAIGLETYHNYTLVHDDIMDKAELRRGKPTLHVKWDENQALLSSEVMVLAAFQGIMKAGKTYSHRLLEVFSEIALEISEGQQLDIEFENRDDVTADEYIEMIRLKTSVLLACALQLGAIQAGASEQDCDLIYEFGEKFGLAFQLQDDLLDVYGDAKTFGKNIGGDILCNKKTYMLINALALAEGEVADELRKWITLADFDPKEKIQAVTAIYDRLGIRQICLEKIHECYD
ncbi:MAG: polyprenyl synthetase family protein, partial [Bacteroidaceae bacterium]|nr:polyprenyl synthetase family protein [Bacteroidaceae bacterium]